MCSLLSRAYAIPVIASSLVLDTDRTAPEPDGVLVEVDIPEGCRLHQEISLEQLGIPLDLHGIDKALSKGSGLVLPSGLGEELRVALAPTPRRAPVWLEFRRPFGYLPVIPWERLVQPLLGIPVLRLPFSAVPAVVRSSSLTIALCAPLAGTAALVEFLQEVVPALPAGTRVEVFTTDPQAHAAGPGGLGVTFHEPPDTLDEDREPPEISGGHGDASLENPWLRWMVGTIAPASVDVLHLICPGRLSSNFGLLDFGASPTGRESDRALRLVSAGQLLACLTELGASSVSFASPGRGEAALRIMAHRMSGLVSGPVVVHAPAAGHAADLAGAFRFLFGSEPEPPPTSPAVAISCHPSLLQPAAKAALVTKEPALERKLTSAITDLTLDKGVTGDDLRGPVQPPVWLAASQRILERYASSLIGTDTDPEESETAADGVTNALKFISDTIEGTVQDTVREDGGHP